MTNHARFLLQKRFGSLDGLRAISILAVIWHHTVPTSLVGTMAIFGAHGVTLFFAISGFLITTLLLRENDRTGTIDFQAFYIRRTFRILPLYFGVLLIYILTVAFLEKNTAIGQVFFENLKYFATFTSNIFVPLNGRVIFYFSWSVASEEQFYLLWPALLFLARTRFRAAIVLSFVIVACIADQLYGGHFLSKVPVALIGGALLSIILHDEKSFNCSRTLIGHNFAFPIIIIFLILAITKESIPSFTIHLLFVAMLASCVVREDNIISAILSFKPIAYIGSISYGMYMLHMLSKNASIKILTTLNFPTSGFSVFVTTIAFSIMCATLSFKYYESFFLKMKKRFER